MPVPVHEFAGQLAASLTDRTADNCRYYVSARGSATESAALLDVLSRLALLDEAAHKTGKEILVRVHSMSERALYSSVAGQFLRGNFSANCRRAKIGHGHGHAYDPDPEN